MRVLLLAATTGYQLRSFTEAAARLGIELTLATDRCDHLDDPWRDGAVAVRFHDEEFSVAAIMDAARERPLSGVLAVGDRPTAVAARAAEALSLPGNPRNAADATRNKRLMRERLAAAGLEVPWFAESSADADVDALAAITYPAVVKPLGLSGSRGVIRVDTPAELRAAVGRVRALLARPAVRVFRTGLEDHLLIERYIEGREYAVEGLLTNGALRVLAVFDKPDPLEGPFFEETIYVTPSAAPADVRHAIVNTVQGATAALGLVHGPIHAECRVGPTGVVMLEVAARPIGGLCSKVLRFRDPGTQGPRDPGTQGPRDPRTPGPMDPWTPGPTDPRTPGPTDPWTSLEELLLRHACGFDVSTYAADQHAAGVMMIPIPTRGVFKGVEGEHDARSVRDIEDVRITAKVDQLLEPLPEGDSYLGFIFARAETSEQAISALREAHRCLQFRIAPQITVTSETLNAER